MLGSRPLLTVIACCLVSVAGFRHVECNVAGLHMDAAPSHEAPGIQPDNWSQWLQDNARNLGKRLFWVPADVYEVVYEGIVLPDGSGPCKVSLIVYQEPNDLFVTLYAQDVLHKLVSSEALPAPEEKGSNGKEWELMLKEGQCLTMGLNRNGKGHIYEVGTRLPSESGGCGCFARGNMLVQLADYIACQFGQTSMSLTDVSQLECRNNPKVRTSMKLFYILKHGKSWYESFGYRYNNSVDQFTVQMLKEKSNESFSWSENPNDPALLQSYQASLGGQQDVSNREFVLWVWDQHCEKWQDVIQKIYQVDHASYDTPEAASKTLDCQQATLPRSAATDSQLPRFAATDSQLPRSAATDSHSSVAFFVGYVSYLLVFLRG